MSIAVVIGLGPNDLEIPLLLFKNKRQAINFLQELGKNITKESGLFSQSIKNECIFDLDEERAEKDEDYEYSNPDQKVLMDALFTSYYGGCGGCYQLEVREVEFGKPFVPWNLD